MKIENKLYEGLLEHLDVAFLAIGGAEFQEKDCTCDTSVGYCPCQYCAIHSALVRCKDFVLAQKEEKK